MKFEKFLVKNHKFVLWLVFVLAIILRWWYLPDSSISFAYDQARDAFLAKEMLLGDFKILGPPVSGIPGLYHGVLYYYLIAPIYYLGQGDPRLVAFFYSTFLSLGIFLVYLLAKVISKNISTALLASVLFAVSFESGQYANLLTNASMGILFVPLMYFGLYSWIIKKSRYAPFLTGLGLGLSIQSEVALGYHILPLVLWLWLYRKTINRQELVSFLLSFVVSTMTMILVELKFGFPGTKGLIYLLAGKDEIASERGVFGLLWVFLKQTGITFSYTIFPQNVVLGGTLGFLAFLYALKKGEMWSRFLGTYVFAHIIGLPFGGGNMRHLMVGAVGGICIFLAIFLRKYFWQKRVLFYVILLVMVSGNITKTLSENKNGQTIFPLQLDLILSKEIQVVDYTYEKAAGRPFSISSLTSPLYVNTLWSYLYNWHGNGKYGYLPYYRGKDQIGQLGNNLEFAPGNVDLHFFIIEPLYGIPEQYVGYAKGEQESLSELVSEKSFGELVVQERRIKK